MPPNQSSGLMTQAEYARHRKVNRSYISRLAKRGILVMRGGKVDVAASDAVLDDRPVDVESQEPVNTVNNPRPPMESVGAAQPTSFAQARTAEMIFRAKLRKLEFEAKSGKLIPADEVKIKWFTLGRQIRDKLLGMPAKLAPQLAALSDAREVRELLESEITAILKSVQEEIRHGGS
jgi:phage terminase Nu1 subunit (DNA packaging protein)